MKARGKIVREPSSGPGLVMIDGRQFAFDLDGIWRSRVAPRRGLNVEVQFDGDSQVAGITVIDDAELQHEVEMNMTENIFRKLCASFPGIVNVARNISKRLASRSTTRVFTGFLLLFLIGSGAASGQSVWQKLKQKAKQAQQGQQPAQQQPAQQQPAQSPQYPRQPAAAQAQNDSGPFKPPTGTKIEEKTLAPVEDRAKFEISPHGVHVATIENDGSRSVVWYDGVEGPKFDDIITQDSNYAVAFSPDGNRYGYCARSGKDLVVMVDGKELTRTPESQGGIFNCQLGFTSNSKHVFYLIKARVENPIDMNYGRFVFDGKSDPPFEPMDPRTIAFSPDGDHYAYVWNEPRHRKPWMLIVDGKPAPYQGGTPQWTNDSKHLYTQRTNSTGTELLYDGKPIARAFNFRVFIAPVGDMVVTAITGGTNFHPYSFLVVNGKKVPGSDTVERGSIDDVVFSPDGKHYAAICGDINAHHYVIADGKRGQEYVSVTDLAFTADSSTLVYESNVNGKGFLVVGDKEFSGSAKPVLAPSGNRFGTFLLGNSSASMKVLIDGNVTPLGVHGGSDLGFSPDGKHVAFVAADDVGNGHLMLDGTRLGESATSLADRIDPANVGALKYVFSPDGQHIAFLAHVGDAHGIAFDGKFIPTPGPDNTFLRFSPDSKHLFWLRKTFGSNAFRLMADGKPVIDFFPAGSVAQTAPQWWDFNPDGSVSFLAQDDNSLKRITITPSAQTSVATMAGGGGAALASRAN